MKRSRGGPFGGPKLPKELLTQLDASGESRTSGGHGGRQSQSQSQNQRSQERPRPVTAAGRRKELRKAQRAQPARASRPAPRHPPDRPAKRARTDQGQPGTPKRPAPANAGDSDDDNDDYHTNGEDSDSDNNRKDSKDSFGDKTRGADRDVDGQDRAELDAFDAQIAALERKLAKEGGRGQAGDELDGLLAGISSGSGGKKTKSAKVQARLGKFKEGADSGGARLKPGTDVLESDSEFDSGDDEFGLGALGEYSSSEEESDGEDGSDVASRIGGDSSEEEGEEGEEDDDDYDDENSQFMEQASDSDHQPEQKQARQNPYLPAVTATAAQPSSRPDPLLAQPEDEASRRLHRQIQAQINKMSEQTLVNTGRAVAELYQSNARNAVTTKTARLLIAAVDSESTVLDSYIILHAGFAAVMARLGGIDFAANMVAATVEAVGAALADAAGKRGLNTISLLCYLFVLGLVGPAVVFDYLKRFLGELSELNTEYVLRIVKCCGPQLRQDDPGSLKDIVILLQAQTARAGSASMSVRTRFMIDTIEDLKNNKLRQVQAGLVSAEMVSRLKKAIGTLPKGPEPLQIGLDDLANADKKGKWWIVGASWKGSTDRADAPGQPDPSGPDRDNKKKGGQKGDSDGEPDIDAIARSLGMSTAVRRAIFRTVVTSGNAADALIRLGQLRLSKTQRLEVPRIVVQAALAEQFHNPYYGQLARQLCAESYPDRKAFLFVIWDYWRRMGVRGAYGAGGGDDDGDQDSDGEDGEARRDLSLNELVNLASLVAQLVASETQPLGRVLKPVLEGTIPGGTAPVLLHPPRKARLFLRLFLFRFFLDASSSSRWTAPKTVRAGAGANDDDDVDGPAAGDDDAWERPYAGRRPDSVVASEKLPAEEVIAKLASNVVAHHPAALDPLLYFCNKHVRVRDDGTGGLAEFAQKKKELRRVRDGWLTMEAVLRAGKK